MINANSCAQFIKTNAPTIFTAAACVGTVATAVLTAKSTTLAIERIADYCEDNLRSPEDLTWREKFAVSYRVYIPPAITAVATLVSIVAANRIQYSRGAAFALAYTGSEAAFKRYREAVADVVKPKDLEKVKARVAEKSVQDAGKPVSGSVLVASSGDVLCYDGYSRDDISSPTLKQFVESRTTSMGSSISSVMPLSMSSTMASGFLPSPLGSW